ncbi:MAG: phosphoribosylformylglycinamidine synthase, partial [Proteobacteria bacterium]|nr:phosphoribosylformylglycinamidine synthase [Pseudomonadota bacterium]
SIDEAVRRLVAVGADLDHIGGVDNFCWPNIQYHPSGNPDGRFKAAQLVRSCMALRETCLAYKIPLLSGKDSMYVDGHLEGPYKETRKVSALETLQFSAIGVMDDVEKSVTMDCKIPGDLVYIAGLTQNELGASEYYECLGFTGLNVPVVRTGEFKETYKAVQKAIAMEITASVHGVYRGGLGVHLALVALGGCLGMDIDLDKVPSEGIERDDTLLFSESCGRFIITVNPADKSRFE